MWLELHLRRNLIHYKIEEMPITLKLPSHVKRIEKEGKILFFNPDVPSWLVTNSNGALLLSMCDGKASVTDIVAALSDTAGEKAAAQARRFFNEAIASHLFEEPLPGEVPVKQEYQELTSVQLSISDQCNLNCRYCYATDRKESVYPQLQMDDYRRLVDGIQEMSCNVEFTLTGGEPLLNPDVFNLARYIRRKGASVDVLTNGTLITEKNIEEVEAAFDKVSISLDGSTAALHDAFRGHGSHERTEHAIRLLESHRVPYRLSMTVNRLNIGDVEAMAHKYGDRMNFQPLFPAGNAKRGTDISISGVEYYEALKNATGVNPLGYCEATLDASQQRRRCKCAVGGSEISISATGDVYPCQLLHYPEFLMGNVHEKNISEIVSASSVVEQCAAMVVDNIEGCRDCFLRYVCGGACRARAYHECRNIMTSGTFCEYERRAFTDGIFSLYTSNLLDNHH